MKYTWRSIRVFSLLLAGAVLSAYAQTTTQPLSAVDAGFRERAMAHVRQLAGFGNRVAAGPGETKAVGYVKEQMEKAGLAVTVEPFSFQAFDFQQATLKAGEQEANTTLLAFDPFEAGQTRSGELSFAAAQVVNSAALNDLQAKGKILVTTQGANPYRLMLMKEPAAIAYLSQEDFERLQSAAPKTGQIAFEGKVLRRDSANVVGVLKASQPTTREVILSAHLDSWKGPGANDNATGVAVLLELARQLAARKAELPFTVRFVTFGAEEFGMLGAKAYLAKHESELQDCALLFNIDSVGGSGDIVAQTRGSGRLPGKIANQLPKDLMDRATNDLDPKWVLNHPGLRAIFSTPAAPDWIRQAIEEAGTQLGLPIRGSGGMGSDQAVFLQAGVPATNIAVSGGKQHSSDDTPENVRPESLESAARIVLTLVVRAR